VKLQNSPNNLSFAVRCTIIAFAIAGLVAVLGAIAYQPAFASGRVFLLLAVAACTARAKVNLYRGTTLSFLTAVVLLAVLKEGPAVAALLAICGVTIQAINPQKKIVLHRLIFNAGMIALTSTGTWWIHHMLIGSQPAETISAETIATILASFTYFLGNSLSVALIVALTKGMSLFHIWSQHFLYSAPSFLIAGLLSLGVIAASNGPSLLILGALTGVVAIAYYCSVRLTQQPAH
jgi:hypothetical protein